MTLGTNALIFGGAAAVAGAIAVLGKGKSDPLEIGDRVPNIQVTIQSGEVLPLRDETLYQLVYFYPKADTPGCTKQACSLRDSFADLVDHGVKVYGVSTDDEEDLVEFKEQYHLPFDLISDKNGKVAEAFGVPLRFSKFAARQAFLFKNGELVWRDLSASTAEQAQDVIKVLDRDGQ